MRLRYTTIWRSGIPSTGSCKVKQSSIKVAVFRVIFWKLQRFTLRHWMKHRLRQNKIALMLSVSGTATSGHYIYAAKCHVKKGIEITLNFNFMFEILKFELFPPLNNNKKKKENSFHDIKNLYKMLKYYKQRMKSVFLSFISNISIQYVFSQWTTVILIGIFVK